MWTTACVRRRVLPVASPGQDPLDSWWTRWDSNPQPPACKAGDLPVDLRARCGRRWRTRTADLVLVGYLLHPLRQPPVNDDGAESGTRTRGLRFTRAPLCQLSYLGEVRMASPRGFEPRLAAPKTAVLPLNDGEVSQSHPTWSGNMMSVGCGCRSRTDCLLGMSQARKPFLPSAVPTMRPMGRISATRRSHSLEVYRMWLRPSRRNPRMVSVSSRSPPAGRHPSHVWRRAGDSNPEVAFAATRFPGALLSHFGQLSLDLPTTRIADAWAHDASWGQPSTFSPQTNANLRGFLIRQGIGRDQTTPSPAVSRPSHPGFLRRTAS